MKETLSSFDLMALVAEWQRLVGGYIDKVYQAHDEVFFRINTPGAGRQELYCRAGKWLALHETEEKPETLPAFATALRRHIGNARITAIEQRGFDRVAVFTLDRGDTYQLILEMFGKGNIVLVTGGNTIAALRTQAFKARQIRAGIVYDFPPAGTNPLDLDRQGFHAAIRGAKGPVVKVLASVLNFGGQYAEELCLRAGTKKETVVKELRNDDLDALFTAVNNIAVAVEQERRPALILQGVQPVDVAPIDLAIHAGLERREFPTLNEALHAYLSAIAAAVPEEKDAMASIRHRIGQLEASLESLRREAVDAEARAIFLYGHFPLFEELLRAIREGREFDQAQIKNVDRAKGAVSVAIGDFDALELDYRKDVNGNAHAFYEVRREARRKADRVLETIRASQEELRSMERKAVKAARRPKAKGTKKFWFEAYRWCVSSEGFLILGGRDAKTNDALVRKHLKDGDRYAHADIHGAPSVIVKEGSAAGEATLREACELALIYSKAWPAGLSSGSAFWVLPEQVSKQAESGEFLPRGAFVVRGKRNYVHDVPLEVAIGEVEHEGHRKVMAGAVRAVAARATKRIVLGPGEIVRDRIIPQLAKAFEVPAEEVARILPSGAFRVLADYNVELGFELTR